MNLFFLRWNDDSNLLLGLGLPSKIRKTQVHDFLCVFRSQHMEGGEMVDETQALGTRNRRELLWWYSETLQAASSV